MNSNPLVSICCITYNHEKYIQDAIDGFLMQKTDFPIEIIIRDDASTDATAEIIRTYKSKHPDTIRTIYHSQNQYTLGKKAFPEVFRMAPGKYIALCEGDDYWTDPLKLQKQVDFLEAHPDCSLCFHKTLRRYEDQDKDPDWFPSFSGDQILRKEDLYRRNFINTCAVVFRNIAMEDYFTQSIKLRIGDWPLFVYLAQYGDIGFLDDIMAVYRVHKGGIHSSKDYLYKLETEIECLKFFKQYKRIKNSKILNQSLARDYFTILKISIDDHDDVMTRRYLLKSLKHLPFMNRKRFYSTIKIFFGALFSKINIIN